MKKFILILSIVSIVQSASAQMDISFLHAGSNVPQVNIFQPVSFPDARVFVALPVISGVKMRLNGEISANDIFPEGDSYLNRLSDKNSISFDFNTTLYQIGFRLGDYGAVTLFGNERITSSFGMPTRTADFLINNSKYLGESRTDDDFGFNLNHFREYGIGYTHSLKILGDKELRVGGRLKYLQGVFNMETSPDAAVHLRTDSVTFIQNIRVENLILQTAGLEAMDQEDAEYLITNGNTGFGIDIGAELDVNDKLTVGFAVNDLGKISWNDYVKNYTIDDGEIDLKGGSFNDIEETFEALADSLESFIEEETNERAYSSSIPTRVLLDARYEVIKGGNVRASTLFKIDEGNHAQIYALGYSQSIARILDVSATVSYQSLHGFSVGGGLAARFGFLQLYGSAENIPNYISSDGLVNNSSLNFRFGANFLFGRKYKKQKENKVKEVKVKTEKPVKETIDPFPEEYNLQHLNDLGHK
ncbi:DUF5723 family protein [Reichenbachiella versicolor]|uniref:DUF5723 family protein n=1 Tax=Reichenbachiella versicolor TaxID=1821036 RepID=UPI000D6E031F|nr:DUF5723 family protein [Reichenbachiella versicolor]